MLVQNYYSIENRHQEGDVTVFDIVLHRDCEVYKGHFPDTPVSPGVCNVQMITECVESVVGRPLMLSYIQQCRLTTLITPVDYPKVQVRVNAPEWVGETLKTRSVIGNGEEVYLDLKGEYKPKIQAV